jgi:hypothetical protein
MASTSASAISDPAAPVTLTPYSSKPLGVDEIRLLTLKAGQGDIRISLQTVSLSADPQYEALSYAWHKSIADDTRTDPSVPYESYSQSILPPRRQHNLGLMNDLGWDGYDKFRPNFSNAPSVFVVCQFGGVPTATNIECDEHSIAIGGELYQALLHLQRKDEDRVLWVGMF